jgi:hypothetical protein
MDARDYDPDRALLSGGRYGALPALPASTDPGVLGGQYLAPDGFAGMRGFPKVVESSHRSRDVPVQLRLRGAERGDVCSEPTRHT